MASTSVVTDWFSVIQRQREKVKNLLNKRMVAEFAHQQAEAELEKLKATARAAGERV